MTLSDLSIRNPVFAWMLMAALIIFGGIGFMRLGVSQMPDVDFPVVNVSVTLEGAAPEVMESDVADVIEDAVATVEGIKEVSSSSRLGMTNVTIEFDLSRNIDAALQDVQTKIAQAQRNLPREIDPPVVTKTNPEDQPIMYIALTGNRPPQELADWVRNRLKDQLQMVPGVGDILLPGYRERNVRVWLDGARLQAYGLTVTDVLNALKREHVEIPAGRIETGEKEMNVRAEGEAMSIADFGAIVIAEHEGSQIRLQNVAIVEDGLEDKRRISRSMGLPAQGMGIRKQRGTNAVAVADGVKKKLEELRKILPKDLNLAIVFDGTAPVEESIHEIEFTLILSVLLTGLVCWLFLGSFSSTLNVLLSIPTSIIGTFAVLYFFGFTLNTFTLLGLSLSVGIVVDDAIMVLENIYRHAERGASRLKASLDGAREITFAAMAATAAIIAIFLPVAFMKGIIGKFFFQFGVTVSVAVAFSLLEAITLTPSRCSQFLDVGERTTWIGRQAEATFNRLSNLYKRALGPCLRHRYLVLAAMAGIFLVSLSILGFINREFVPSQDISRVLARVQTPVGSSIDYTDELMKRCEQWVVSRPEVKLYFAVIGGFGGSDVNTSALFVTLKPRSERHVSQAEFMADMRRELNKIPSLRVTIQDLSQAGFTAQRGFPVEFTVRGQDWGVLADNAQKIMGEMKASPLFVDVDTDYLVGMPEVQILPDRKLAADLGVSMQDIGDTVNSLIGGVRAVKFQDKGKRYDVRVRLLAEQRLRPEDISPLFVRTRTGDLVRLSDIVHVDVKPSLLTITRRNKSRAIGLFANVAPGKSQADALAEVQAISKRILPEGYQVVFSGSAQTFQESFTSLIFALFLGLLVSYMVLASQFNSFNHPITVLMALPFSFTGALIALWVTGQSLNVYSMIGIILLMGIVKKNSIILVDYTNQLRRAGRDRDQALLEACPIRLRPILMTSLSTIAGAIPAAVSLGPGAELRQPMALAVIGGVIVSTGLTLFAVPAAYHLLDSWFGHRREAFERSYAQATGASGAPLPATHPASAVPLDPVR
ncbi:MAG TPA: efflux RND transporter permease subunit [Candidatus Polarisedimenticolia bacterium]|jgi:hydrophobe/amphiphile efflux-1 (HAE1) family protein|nr:efflux RND transporter permease subunit [Candidatus Polarisedimenticolia bacterium]